MKYVGKAGTVLLLVVSLCLVNCTTSVYDDGDGSYSYLYVDLAEAHTVSGGVFDHAQTDGGLQLNFSPPFEADWATTPDSLYRVLVYFNKMSDEQQQTVSPISIRRVAVLRPHVLEDPQQAASDPVVFESAWMSADRRYLNLGLALMTGQPDDEEAAHQMSVGVMSETDDTVSLLLLHSQGGMPEYYSSKVFVSIPVSNTWHGKTIQLQLSTYKGLVSRSFQL